MTDDALAVFEDSIFWDVM